MPNVDNMAPAVAQAVSDAVVKKVLNSKATKKLVAKTAKELEKRMKHEMEEMIDDYDMYDIVRNAIESSGLEAKLTHMFRATVQGI